METVTAADAVTERPGPDLAQAEAIAHLDNDVQIIGALSHYRWAIAATIVVAIALVLVQQALTPARYRAYTVVSPANTTSSGSMSKLGRLATFAGIDLSSAKPASNFERFQFLLTSPQLAAYQIRQRAMLKLVFADRWDSSTRSWKKPTGIASSISAAFNPVFGLPAETDPDAQALASYYSRALDQQKVPDTGMIKLVYQDSSPARAALILSLMVGDANEMLRQDAEVRARRQAGYLRQRLAETQVQDYRQTLVDLLTEQEQTLLFSNGEMPFAAEQIESVNGPQVPTKRPLLFAAIAGVLAFSFAALVAVVAFNRRRHRDPAAN